MLRYYVPNRTFRFHSSWTVEVEAGEAYLVGDETEKEIRLTVFAYSHPAPRELVLANGTMHDITAADIARCDAAHDKVIAARRSLEQANLQVAAVTARVNAADLLLPELLASSEFASVGEQTAKAAAELRQRLQQEREQSVDTEQAATAVLAEAQAEAAPLEVLAEMIKRARWSGKVPLRDQSEDSGD